MITTREAINYQFSLIFGYSSPNNIIVGDVIGPGKLTKEKVSELSQEVIKFIRMYNAILRDYAGSELFSIEFSLDNLNEIFKMKDAHPDVEILPKSMILIPGKYKDCESLLLALKPETGYLDTHKSSESINNISELFYEVEEFTDRPELGINGKEKVFKKFAQRFSKKLYGELIEDKWNKKLIGLNVSLPTEKEMLNTYATIKSHVDTIWYKKPYEIILFNPEFQKVKTPFEGQIAIDHLKYVISEPSANFIIENTLKLGTNLINLANTGTIDESQDSIISYIIYRLKEKIESITDVWDAAEFLSRLEDFLNNLKNYVNSFLKYSQDFLVSGEMGNLSYLLEKYEKLIIEKGKIEKVKYEELYQIAINFINQSIIQEEDLRAIELSSLINYLSELIKNSFNIIKRSFPKYLFRRRLKTLIIEFINALNEKFEKEQEPSRGLGKRFIEKFKHFLLNQIEINSLMFSKDVKYEEENIIKEFKSIIYGNIDSFFDDITLDISDLVSFAEIEMMEDSNFIKTHIESFKKFSGELNFLLSYILRYSTINRYLKDGLEKDISDPVKFAEKFHRFLEKRIGGINLTWKSYILEWIDDFKNKYLRLEQEKKWTLKEIYDVFMEYFEQRKESEQKTEKFLEFLDKYIAKIPNEAEKKYLMDFFQKYEICIDIKTEFPKYMKNKIKQELDLIDLQFEKLIPINFFSIDEQDTFYNYIKEIELKYFSKLIPRPISLILEHSLSNDEKQLFKSELFHVFNFRFWGKNNSKIELADNFKEVYREWLKEL